MFYQSAHLGSADYLSNITRENLSFPPHLHQTFELVVVLSGEMTVTVDNAVFPVTSGNALLVFPNQIHSLETKQSECIICIFSPRLVQAYTGTITDRIPGDNRFCPDPWLVGALSGLREDASQAEKKGILYSLCAAFDRQARYKSRQSDRQKLLYNIFRFVEEHFREDCSLDALARVMGYDYAYLSRYFRKTTGIAYNTYVNHFRLSQACYLMENPELPLIRCASESGFASLRSFNRIFRDYMGLTPTQYRKKLQKQ